MNANDVIGIDEDKVFSRVLFSAVVGGTVSKLTGGKFGNGAVTAAFAQMFNGEKGAKNERRMQSLNEYMKEKYGDLQISDEERAFASKGDRKAF